jgi:hypothetical protein
MRPDVRIAVTVMLVAACGLSTGPASEDAQDLELSAGEEIAIPGTVLRVGFIGVAEDSRCPIDVVCVWEGNAAVELGLTAGSGPTHQIVLNTGIDPDAVDFMGVRVTLVGVSPYPREGQGIPPEDYVVTLRVEPLPA